MRKRRAYQQLVDIAGRSDGQEGGHLPATSDQLLRAYACFASARMRRCRRNAGTQQHTASLDKESPCPREQAYPHPSGALLRIGGGSEKHCKFLCVSSPQHTWASERPCSRSLAPDCTPVPTPTRIPPRETHKTQTKQREGEEGVKG
jgi:hypothetical protein